MICKKHSINSANFKESYSMKFAYFVDGFILVIKRFNFHFLWSVRSGNSVVILGDQYLDESVVSKLMVKSLSRQIVGE